MGLTPDEIEAQEFVRARRGFDPDEVRGYLQQIGREVRDLEARLTDAVGRAEAAEAKANQSPGEIEADQFGALGGRVAEMLRLAQESGAEIRSTANAEAEAMLAAARAESDSMVTRAESTLDTSRAESEALLANARNEAETLSVESRLEAETLLSRAEADAEQLMSSANAEAETSAEAKAKADYDVAEKAAQEAEAAVAPLRDTMKTADLAYAKATKAAPL